MSAPVGFIVSWKVPKVIPLSDLRDGLRAAGLDPLDLAPDLRPASIVARSAGFVARLNTTKDARRLARPVAHMSRQITREETVLDRLAYTREASITYDEPTGKLMSDDAALQQMLPSVASEVYDTRTASDVTRIIQQIVETAGSDLIPVREQGGAYFIPSGNHIITKIDSVLKKIGGELSTFACTLGHGTDESVSLTITDYLVKQIEELQESVDLLNEKGLRSDVKNRRLSRVAELKEKISVYASLISTGTEKLNAELARAESTLLAKLGPEDEEEAYDGKMAAAGV